MATEVVMPQMGYDMTEGTVVKWVKHEGDVVKKGDIIAEIETDKATVEMEADAAGMLRRVIVSEGTTVPVGAVIGLIGTADEALPEVIEATQPKEEAPAVETASAQQPREGEVAEAPAPTPVAGGMMKASPVARRLADEQGIDLRQVTGTGPGGRITKDDVLAYTKQAPAAVPAAPAPEPVATEPRIGKTLKVGPEPRKPDAGGRVPLSKMAQAIARRTAGTKGPVPHYYVNASVDMTAAMDFRRELNAQLNDVRVSVNDLTIKAAALALQKFPVFNSTFQGDHLQVAPNVNVGIAVALDEGLVVPAVLECEKKSLVQIAAETKDLGERTRAGRLRQDEYTAGTFSISNLGMFDVDSFTAIIVSPQAAVLAVGSVTATPQVRDGEVVVRQVMQASLSADHRISNGADAAQFLVEIKRLLESPLSLIADRLT